jgi:hypothetical protein
VPDHLFPIFLLPEAPGLAEAYGREIGNKWSGTDFFLPWLCRFSSQMRHCFPLGGFQRNLDSLLRLPRRALTAQPLIRNHPGFRVGWNPIVSK